MLNLPQRNLQNAIQCFVAAVALLNSTRAAAIDFTAGGEKVEKLYVLESHGKSGKNRVINVALGILMVSIFLICFFLMGFLLKEKLNELGDLSRILSSAKANTRVVRDGIQQNPQRQTRGFSRARTFKRQTSAVQS